MVLKISFGPKFVKFWAVIQWFIRFSYHIYCQAFDILVNTIIRRFAILFSALILVFNKPENITFMNLKHIRLKEYQISRV